MRSFLLAASSLGLAFAARTPTVPRVRHVQVMRYVFPGRTKPLAPTPIMEVKAWRRSKTARGPALDAKVEGRSLQATGSALKRLHSSMIWLADGGPVEAVVLSSMSTAGAYRARWGGGWPDEAP